ncbi:tripartite tricarboxylate transporter TctB family protein [Azospirillum picis]|uniref:Tricarboxylic transport membrane protein n=1 Tax=Azospirillum picis TaxID=488438 RepID=A0ABU0MCP3_9PROT|nr:tripartite tricarboxylate transporter TctB family protein [Azospirillum picis]MBP2297769.1 putative tricarboxylic transport membrane protein [Azospirillum picis]MDQ0531208.1 putative tricarboxylic transport membrane protein [Azospirillum picis]
MTTGRSLRIGEALLGGGLAALGALIAVETMLTPSAGRGVVGPALFPYLIAGGLVLIGLSLLREAFAGHIAHDGGLELDLRAVVLVAAGLAAQFLLIEFLGWIPAATLLFVAVARAFGSRRYLLNVALGLLLAGATFAVFNYGLDLNLPSGIVGDWFEPAE